MKKLLCTILSILLIIPVFGYFNGEKVHADGAYEVAYINDDGSFKTIATYGDLKSAEAKMKEDDDYVVRHANSKSSSKIISMNSGLVYSYPYRRGYSTMNLYETVNSSLVGSGVSTYVAEHYEMTYHSTYYYYESKGYGYVEVTLNGFHGYCDLEYSDLVPSKFIENKIPITLGGGDITGANEQPFKVVLKQNYYYVNEEKGYRDLVFVFHRGWSKDGGDCLESKLSIGVAPEFMNANTRYYSNDGINFYTDRNLEHKAGTCYNYYQFLPLRTKTNISASTMNSFLAKNAPSTSILLNEGSAFINAQNNYGCNAASILCMAIHESGWGDSNIARGKYNLFGWGAFDDATSNATRYSSVEDCVDAQMADNLANYMDVRCSRYFSMSLGNKGGGFVLKYASDPYWAEKIASHYYSLDKYAGGGNGKLTDYNTYSLALVNTKNAAIKNSPSGNILYTLANKQGYQKNLIVAPLTIIDGYTKVNTSNPIYDDGVCYPIELPYGTLVDYSYSKSVGYIRNTDLIFLDNGVTSVNPNETTNTLPPELVDPSNLKTMVYVDELDLQDSSDTLSISGFGLIEGLNFNSLEETKHELVFKNTNDLTNEYVYLLTTSKDSMDLNDGYKYDYIHYAGDININELPFGSYIVYLRVTNKAYTKDSVLKKSDSSYANIVSNNTNYSSRVTTNKAYGYRLEFEKLSTPINYKNILKKRNTPSVFSYDDITIDENLNLNIEAIGYLPGVNFSNTNDVTYSLYLIANNSDYKKIDCTIIDNAFDYNGLLNVSYKLEKITYKASINLKDLSGNYTLLTEVKCKDTGVTYVDYLKMNNKANMDLPNVTKDSKEYKVVLSNDLENTILSINEVSE